ERLVANRVEGGDRAVVQVAAVGTLLAAFFVDSALGREVFHRRAVLSEAPLDAHAVGDVFHRVVGGRLVRDATVPGRTSALGAVTAQGARRGIVDLHVE